MAAIPGLIDSHSHAGHGLMRSLGAGDGNAWYDACAEIGAWAGTATNVALRIHGSSAHSETSRRACLGRIA